MSFNLAVAKGRHQGKVIPLNHSPFIIGRHHKCQLRAASMEISRQHCAIEIDGDRVRIKDLGSTNGTFVNNQKIEGEHELHDQDCLQVGPLSLTVQLNGAGTADTQPGAVAADTQPGIDQPTPLPTAFQEVDEESAATLLLQIDDLEPPPAKKPAPQLEVNDTTFVPKKVSAAQKILEQYRRSGG